jgi:atypical dual specificity phosphatase
MGSRFLIAMNPDMRILNEIRFGYLHSYKVAGMGEPWLMKMEQTIHLLKQQRIGAVLCLTEDDLYGSEIRGEGFLHHHEPINDGESPTTDGMNRAIAFIDSSLDKGLGIAVHCLEGRGRTGMVLASWIGVVESLHPQEALRRIRELRPHTVLSFSQQAFIFQYLTCKRRK